MSRTRRIVIVLVLAIITLTAAVLSARVFRDTRVFRDNGHRAPAIAGLPLTPPLGWNSWNAFGCDINGSRVKAAADAMVSSGMRDAGYRYVIIDDCWFDPHRDESGHLRGNPALFPAGMRSLADYVHSRGLKFGIYEGANDTTCAQDGGAYAGRTGSRGHEQADAQTFADWGVDYLKYDWCGPAADVDELVDAFTTMRDALRATGRPIFYSINPNSGAFVPPSEFNRFDGIATMTRVSHDVIPAWDTLDAYTTSQGIADAVDHAAEPGFSCTPDRGFFCDYDMLTVGSPQVLGISTPPLNEAEERTQLGLWAVWGAPLLAGNDLTHMSPRITALLTNRDLIAIDQDVPVQRATCLKGSNGSIWTRSLSDGSTAVAIVNLNDTPLPFAAAFSSIGLPNSQLYDVLDVFSGNRSTQFRRYAKDIGPHDTVLLRVKPHDGH